MKKNIFIILAILGCNLSLIAGNGYTKNDDYYSPAGESYHFGKTLELYDAKLIRLAEHSILENIKKYPAEYSADKQYMLLAELDLDNNNLKLADKKLDAFLRERSNSPFASSAKLLRGFIAFRVKDFNNAEKHFELAYKSAQEDLPIRGENPYLSYIEEGIYWRGVSLYHLGRYSESQEEFENLYRNYDKSKYSDDAIYALGMISEASMNYDKSISYYRTLSSKYPYSNYIVSAKLREANDYLIKREPANALIALDNLTNILERIETKRDDGHLYEKQENIERANEENIYLKAEAYHLMDNFVEAEKYYTQFIEQFPNSLIINYSRLGMGRIHLENSNYDAAIKLFDDIITSGIELNNKLLAQTKLFRAVALKRDGKLEDAKKEFATLSLQSDFPMLSDALFELATIQYEEMEYDKSIRSLQRAEKNAQNAEQKIKINLLLGANYLETKRWQDALSEYKSAEKLADKSQEIYLVKKKWYIGEARFKQGIALVNSAKYREAVFPLQLFIAEGKSNDRLDEATFWLAEAFYRSDMLKNAADNYDKIIKNFPNSNRVEESYYGLAWSYFRQKRFGESSRIFEKMMERFPNSKYAAEVYSRQGDGYYLNKQFKQAITAYEKALKISNDNDEGQYCAYQIAHSYFKMGSYDQSVKALLNFVKKFPRSPYSDNALYLVGWIYFQQHRYGEAIDKFKYLMEVYPGSPLNEVAQYSIGDAYYNMGNFDAAIAAYKNVIAKYPGSAVAGDALRSIQYSLESLGRTDEAIKITDDFIQANPESPFAEDLRIKKGELFYSGKRYSDAISEYNAFVNTFPKSAKNPEVYYLMAKSYMNIGDTVNTLKTFDEIVKKYPESEYAPMSLLESGLFLKEINRSIQAESQFDELVKRYPESSSAPQALFEISTIKISVGDTTAGIVTNRQIMDKYPESEYAVLSQYRLAAFFKLTGNLDSAAIYYLKLSENDLNTDIAAESAFRLGEIYQYNGDLHSAVKWYLFVGDKYAGLEDWHSLSLLNLGECYEKLEDFVKAKDAYSALVALRKGDEFGEEADRRLKSIEKK